MTNYDFFNIDGVMLFGTVLNAALLGGIIYLAVRVVRTILKKTEDENKH